MWFPIIHGVRFSSSKIGGVNSKIECSPFFAGHFYFEPGNNE